MGRLFLHGTADQANAAGLETLLEVLDRQSGIGGLPPVEFGQQVGHTALRLVGLDDWSVKLDRAKRRAGCCHHGSKTISLSATLLPLYSHDVIIDIVLHEVAHALAGPQAKHGPRWRSIALQLGASPRASLSEALPSPSAKWVGTCPRCGASRSLHRTPRRVSSCGKCSSSFEVGLILRWTCDGEAREPSGAYRKELGALIRRARLLSGRGPRD